MLTVLGKSKYLHIGSGSITTIGRRIIHTSCQYFLWFRFDHEGRVEIR